MRKCKSVAVVGGGVVGMCTALALQERGLSVTLADSSNVTSQASWGNAGRIAVELSEPLASFSTLADLPRTLFFRGGPVSLPLNAIATWIPFGLRLLSASAPHRFARGKEALGLLLSQALPAWRRRLEAIGASSLLVELGHYSVWENRRRSVSGRAAWGCNPGACTTMELHPRERAKLQSVIKAPIADALKFDGSASISDPNDLHAALRTALVKRGGSIRHSLSSIAEAEGAADAVVVAAGIGSATLMSGIGHRVPMVAERGYHIEQSGVSWPEDLPPIFFEDRAIVLTKFRSTLRATSFVEFTTAAATPDRRKWTRLRRHAAELGLPLDDRASEWMGSRPTLPDYLPAIGRSRRQDNVFYAFGHQHLGLTLGALTGELIAALIADDEPNSDLEPFRLDRFD